MSSYIIKSLFGLGILLIAYPPTFAAEITPIPPPRIQKALVSRVIDGDTFTVTLDRTTETIRLIGIDTPELHHPTKTVECFGKEASHNLTSLLLHKNITLVSDPTGDNRDKYGRLLRYAYTQEKAFAPVVFINAALLRDGYAYAYTRFDFRHKEQFKQYAHNAKAHGRGLWAKETCKGKR